MFSITRFIFIFQKKNRLKTYLESLQPSEWGDDYSGQNSTETPAPSMETMPQPQPQPLNTMSLAQDPLQPFEVYSQESKTFPYEECKDVLYIQSNDNVLYTPHEDHKLYQYEPSKNLIMAAYDGGQEKVEIFASDTISRKSILEYAAHDIIMEEQQNALIYSMYDETDHYDTLPLFPDEFTLSCYNNIPPLL